MTVLWSTSSGTNSDGFVQVANLLNEEIPQVFTLCGRGPRSTLRLLRPGLAVTEMAVSPLPGNPTAVWTIKRTMLDEFDAYIIVSFTNATLVSMSHTLYVFARCAVMAASSKFLSLINTIIIVCVVKP